MTRRDLILVVLAGLLLAGGARWLVMQGDEAVDAQKARDAAAQKQAQQVIDEDAALLKDFGLLERRLLQSVKVEDGLILIRDPSKIDFYVLPANSPWVISCGIGLSVIFGTSVSGSTGDTGDNDEEVHVDNDVKLQLVTAVIDQDQCANVAPQLGKRLKALLQEPAH